MKVNDIRERRALLTVEARALLTAAETASRALSTDEAARFDAIKAEITGLETSEARAVYLADIERRATGQPVTGSGDKHFDTECRAFSLVKAMASQVPGLTVDCGREVEVSAELRKRSGRGGEGIAVPMSVFEVERRVMTSTAPVGAPGGNLIATDLRSDLYFDRLRAALRIKQLGATILSGLVGNVDIPNLKTSATAGWVAENTPIPASDLAFAKASLTPRHVGALTEFSRNMLLQSTPDIEELVRADFAAILAEAVDQAAINGPGGIAPTGILTLLGVNTGTTPLNWNNALALIANMEIAGSAGTGWLASPRTVQVARTKTKIDADGSGGFIMDGPNSLAGYPLLSTALMPLGAAIFGKWSDLIIGYWSSFDLLVNPYESVAYSKGNVQVRAMLTCDITVRHIESFAAEVGWLT